MISTWVIHTGCASCTFHQGCESNRWVHERASVPSTALLGPRGEYVVLCVAGRNRAKFVLSVADKGSWITDTTKRLISLSIQPSDTFGLHCLGIEINQSWHTDAVIERSKMISDLTRDFGSPCDFAEFVSQARLVISLTDITWILYLMIFVTHGEALVKMHLLHKHSTRVLDIQNMTTAVQHRHVELLTSE